VPHTLEDLKAEYEANFGEIPADFRSPRTETLWTRFASDCDVDLERVMAKAAELRGKSRARPSLADLKHALAACQDRGPDWHRRLDCGMCNGSGYITVLVNYDPGKPWRETMRLGHKTVAGRVLVDAAVPCMCSTGRHVQQTADGDEGTSRRAMDWRKEFLVECDELKTDPVTRAKDLIGESWSVALAAREPDRRMADA
jgi:hypothetical protein